ncbi:hypothetical protein AAMO2058_001542100 [Amorphochlora amoebiformis]
MAPRRRPAGTCLATGLATTAVSILVLTHSELRECRFSRQILRGGGGGGVGGFGRIERGFEGHNTEEPIGGGSKFSGLLMGGGPLGSQAQQAWYVVKRNGRHEPVMFDKITTRIRNLCEGKCGIGTLCKPLKGYPEYIDPIVVAQKVTQGVHPGVKTSDLDALASQTAAYMSTEHPGYSHLAARIAISNLQKQTCPTFSGTVKMLYEDAPEIAGKRTPYLSEDLYKLVMANAELIDSKIQHSRDFNFDYFGFKTLERAYLLKQRGEIVERPQYMFMRVALGIHGEDFDAAFETYDLMSSKAFLHASPTLFHAGTRTPQLSSCFLLPVKSDSIQGIYDTLKSCAAISKSAGGIGLSVQNIRAKGSYIRGTNGVSNGLVPMLRVFDATARYVDQGGGKRPGAIAVYFEPWHADVFELLDLRKNHGKEEMRARDLFYGLWIPDLFMKRVEANGNWSLMCPDECPGLPDTYGEEFEKLYERYEREGRARRTVRAQELWTAILDAQTETGTPYVLFKDAANRKSNQKNLGTIRCSNLCTEIIEYTSANETAVCNLASIVLPYFVSKEPDVENQHQGAEEITLLDSITRRRETAKFDFQKLFQVSKIIARNLNKVIDLNKYPVPEAKTSNLRHRPMGIGVQGLADMFICMGLPFDSKEARDLNRDVFETIYFGAVTASVDLAKKEGPYETFSGSPMSKGEFQFDMWGEKPSPRLNWDWEGLRKEVVKHGIRNSLFLAPMPTASTAQIMGYNECIEPYTSNLYVRRVKAGEFIVVNPHLLSDLIKLGLWTPEVRNQLMAEGGSVQGIPDIPASLKEMYKTAWELKQKLLVDMAADRGAFVDQSQSLNAFIASPTHAKLTSMHFYAWRKGLKTGMYYLRTKPAAQAIQFTVDNAAKGLSQMGIPSHTQSQTPTPPLPACSGEVCLSCQG